MRIYFFLLFFFIFSFSRSQDSLKRFSFERNPKVQYSISVLSNINQRATINNIDHYKTFTSPQMSFGIGVNRELEIYSGGYFMIGLYGGFIKRNLEFIIPKDEFSPPFDDDIIYNGAPSKESDYIYLRLPLLLRHCLFQKEKYGISLKGGVSFLYSPKHEEFYSYSILHSGSVPEEYLTGDLIVNRRGSPWTALNFGFSYERSLKNGRTLSAGMVGNFSTRSFIEGHFDFHTPNGTPVSTPYSLKASFIGVELKYTLTRIKKD